MNFTLKEYKILYDLVCKSYESVADAYKYIRDKKSKWVSDGFKESLFPDEDEMQQLLKKKNALWNLRAKFENVEF